MMTRSELVTLALTFEGVKQGSKTHKSFVDKFNAAKINAGYGVEVGNYSCPWCDIFATYLMLRAGFTQKNAPMSFNCGRTIDRAQKLDLWIEKDSYVAKKGDFVVYNWNDTTGSAVDCKTGASHIGMIVAVSSKNFTVIEGNKGTSECVGLRTLPINGNYIRGFIVLKGWKSKSMSEKVAAKAKELAWAKGTKKSKYAYPSGKPTAAFKTALTKAYPLHDTWGKAPSKGASCDVFLGVVAVLCGMKKFPRGFNQAFKFTSDKFKVHHKKKVKPYNLIKDLGKTGTYFVFYKKSNGGAHELIYSNGLIYEAQYEKTYGHVNTSLSKLKTKRPDVKIYEFK